MTYRKTDTLREVIFKTLSQVTPSTKVVDMFKLTEELATHIEQYPDLVDDETVQRLRGQLQNCISHLERAKRRDSRGGYDAAIESANLALYETLVK